MKACHSSNISRSQMAMSFAILLGTIAPLLSGCLPTPRFFPLDGSVPAIARGDHPFTDAPVEAVRLFPQACMVAESWPEARVVAVVLRIPHASEPTHVSMRGAEIVRVGLNDILVVANVPASISADDWRGATCCAVAVVDRAAAEAWITHEVMGHGVAAPTAKSGTCERSLVWGVRDGKRAWVIADTPKSAP